MSFLNSTRNDDAIDSISFSESENEPFLDSSQPLNDTRRSPRLTRSVSKTIVLMVKDQESQADTTPTTTTIIKEIEKVIFDPTINKKLILIHEGIMDGVRGLFCCWSLTNILVTVTTTAGLYILLTYHKW
jgi:hypothetical protein